MSDLRQWFSELEDDKFFHVSCHIEPALKSKIEQGGFVDLNKLLLKNRLQSLNKKQSMHFVNKNGESYLVPIESDQRITGVRRWNSLSECMRRSTVVHNHTILQKFGNMSTLLIHLQPLIIGKMLLIMTSHSDN